MDYQKGTLIVRLNNSGIQNDYRKHRKKVEPVTTLRDIRTNTGTEQRRRLPTNPSTGIQQVTHRVSEIEQHESGCTTDHNIRDDSNGRPLDGYPPIVEGGMKSNKQHL